MMLRVKSTMLTKRKSSTLKVTSTATQISDSQFTFFIENRSRPVDSWLKCHKGACNPPRSVQIYHHEQNTDDSDTSRTSRFHVRYNASR